MQHDPDSLRQKEPGATPVRIIADNTLVRLFGSQIEVLVK
jgi:hypothetical protein